MIKKILIIIITISVICITKWNNGSFEILYDTKKANSENQKIIETSNILYSTVIKQIKIGRGVNYDIKQTAGILNVLEQIEYYLKSDIILFLDLAKNKVVVLQNYLSEISHTLELADYFQEDLLLNIKKSNNDMAVCLKQKSISDRDYFDSLSLKDSQSMELALNQSKKSDECISQNRIEINSKKLLLNRLLPLKSTLKEKYDFLHKNQNNIINNFSIIKNNIASELVNLTERLNRYKSD